MGARADLGESLAPAGMLTPDRPLRGPVPILNELLVRIGKISLTFPACQILGGFQDLQTPE